ncbi:hypothetical protein EV122DRAFT_283254 [Schizophyllum commune]
MGQDLRDYSVEGMPFQDFLDAFLPQAIQSTEPCASSEAQPERDTGNSTRRGKKRARSEDTHPPKSISYGRYIESDDDGLLRAKSATFYYQGIKLLPDIFEDGNGGEQEFEHTDTSVSEVLTFIHKAHTVSERLFSLVVFINDGYFRLIRADRDGLIVTKKVRRAASEASVNPKSLNDLIRRFEGITKAQQGNDPTALKRHTRRAMAKSSEVVAVYKIGVPCAGAQDNLRWFYTCGPDVVFIKDSWRSVAGDLLPEAEVIAQLNIENVEFAPKLICGGDIPDQKTVTHEYVDAPWNRGRRMTHEPRVHHQFASNLGQPLWKFESSKHLMQILHDTFTCHRQAVERCRILHRDISAWNILWDEASGRGILSDWDLCAAMPATGAAELDPDINMMAQIPSPNGQKLERTGTWAFMSADMLLHTKKLHDVQDDLESIFWVAMYIITLYFTFHRQTTVFIMDNVVAPCSVRPDGTVYGGHGKAYFLGKATTLPGYMYTLAVPDTVSTPAGVADTVSAYDRRLGALPGRPKPEAPAFRDYQKLDKPWRALLEKGEEEGLFKDNDRIVDELHEGHPEQVLAGYRVLVEQELQEEEAARSARLYRQRHAPKEQPVDEHAPEPRADEHVGAGARTLVSARPRSARDGARPVVDAADNKEEEEAARVAERQRTVANGFRRTSSPTDNQSRRTSSGKARSVTPE